MINKLLIYIFILLEFSCVGNAQKKHDLKIIDKYYKAYNSKNYRMLNKIIDDNIEVIEMKYTVAKSKKDFMNLVKWGEIFNAKNIKESVKEKNGVYIVEEIQDSERIRFLYGKTLQSQTTFSIKNGKIVKIEIDLIDYDSNKMNIKRSKFMNWVKTNYPEKLNTINLLNEFGAQTYKDAMMLYLEENQ